MQPNPKNKLYAYCKACECMCEFTHLLLGVPATEVTTFPTVATDETTGPLTAGIILNLTKRVVLENNTHTPLLQLVSYHI